MVRKLGQLAVLPGEKPSRATHPWKGPTQVRGHARPFVLGLGSAGLILVRSAMCIPGRTFQACTPCREMAVRDARNYTRKLTRGSLRAQRRAEFGFGLGHDGSVALVDLLVRER